MLAVGEDLLLRPTPLKVSPLPVVRVGPQAEVVYTPAFRLAGVDTIPEGQRAVDKLRAVPTRTLKGRIAELAAVGTRRATLAALRRLKREAGTLGAQEVADE